MHGFWVREEIAKHTRLHAEILFVLGCSDQFKCHSWLVVSYKERVQSASGQPGDRTHNMLLRLALGRHAYSCNTFLRRRSTQQGAEVTFQSGERRGSRGCRSDHAGSHWGGRNAEETQMHIYCISYLCHTHTHVRMYVGMYVNTDISIYIYIHIHTYTWLGVYNIMNGATSKLHT